MEATAENLAHLWSFNWGAMEVLIGGKSSIDLTELEIRDRTDATEFLRYYGYDPENPVDAKKMHSVICESWNFIEKYLMPAEWSAGRRPPDDLLMADDARDILLAASDRRAEGALRQAWACAVLRVMHTLAHIDGVAKFADVEAARTQIMNRFLKYIFRNTDGQLCFGSREISVQLDRIEWKLRKSRESILLKLLHKKANVAETIYDLLGMRIITKNLSDVMVVVKFLREFHMVSFPNCNPSRARNSLIDVEGFKHNVDMLREMLEEGRIQPHEFTNILLGLTKPISLGNHANPHSAKDYRAVQLTCRQLIRYPNPNLQWQEKMSRYVGDARGTELMQKVCQEILLLSNTDEKMIEGFFPFELQVMDEESAASNAIGDASHDRYKQSQVKAARRRVLHRVLTLNDPAPRTM
ncbi:MAG: TIGR04552 family protein [Proteobacteria bacterium]|nr:MAG: TIGR04552 family protein [Pseudomonadota bacterium]